MTASESTPNYDFPIYQIGDKVDYLGDWNNAFTRADNEIFQAKEASLIAGQTATASVTVANEARNTADSALTLAQSASTNATTANTKADGAQSAAMLATSTADSAEATANLASSTANTAKNQVDAQVVQIDAAVQTANAASNIANSMGGRVATVESGLEIARAKWKYVATPNAVIPSGGTVSPTIISGIDVPIGYGVDIYGNFVCQKTSSLDIQLYLILEWRIGGTVPGEWQSFSGQMQGAMVFNTDGGFSSGYVDADIPNQTSNVKIDLRYQIGNATSATGELKRVSIKADVVKWK